MAHGDLNKPDYAREIGAALSVIRNRRAKVPARPPAPEIFDLYCVCAVYDRPYTLRFVRQASGLLHFAESVRATPMSSPNNARGGGAGWTLKLDYFENAPTPCAWCGNGDFHHCATYCGALVCGGRMKGETFHCRQSCGAQWVGVPLKEVTGMSGELERSSHSYSPRNNQEISARKPLMLPAGKILPVRR